MPQDPGPPPPRPIIKRSKFIKKLSEETIFTYEQLMRFKLRHKLKNYQIECIALLSMKMGIPQLSDCILDLLEVREKIHLTSNMTIGGIIKRLKKLKKTHELTEVYSGGIDYDRDKLIMKVTFTKK